MILTDKKTFFVENQYILYYRKIGGKEVIVSGVVDEVIYDVYG